MADKIQVGDYVALVKIFDSSNMKIIPVSEDATIHYGRLRFNAKALIGSPFGSIYEIKGDKMTMVENFDAYNNELSDKVASKMTTYDTKSQFSREKIVRKKKRKCHANIVTVIKPTLVLINEMLFAREKIGGLRIDVLAQIITLSNIQNKSRCLVLDHNLGIITSAVASRILPEGICIQLLTDYEVLYTARSTMNMLNIREADWPDSILSITIRDFYKIFKGVDQFCNEDAILQARADRQLDRLATRLEQIPSGTSEITKKARIDPVSDGNQVMKETRKKNINRINRHRERAMASKYIKQCSLDALILVVQNDHPIAILRMLLPFLSPSRQFVVYSDTLGLLVECQQYLKEESLAVSLQINETWLRRYQVLLDRTRPEMNATGYSGYLLSGTKAGL